MLKAFSWRQSSVVCLQTDEANFNAITNSDGTMGILIRLTEMESISFEIIENFDYCPTLNKVVKYFMRNVNIHSKTKKNVDKVTV